MQNFGLYLRQKRQEKKISLRKLANVASISVSYLSRMEIGKSDPCAAAKLVRIAEKLDLDIDEFLAVAGRVDPYLTTLLNDRPELAHLLRRIADKPKRRIAKIE